MQDPESPSLSDLQRRLFGQLDVLQTMEENPSSWKNFKTGCRVVGCVGLFFLVIGLVGGFVIGRFSLLIL